MPRARGSPGRSAVAAVVLVDRAVLQLSPCSRWPGDSWVGQELVDCSESQGVASGVPGEGGASAGRRCQLGLRPWAAAGGQPSDPGVLRLEGRAAGGVRVRPQAVGVAGEVLVMLSGHHLPSPCWPAGACCGPGAGLHMVVCPTALHC